MWPCFFLQKLRAASPRPNRSQDSGHVSPSAGDLTNLKEKVQESFSLQICGVIDIRRSRSLMGLLVTLSARNARLTSNLRNKPWERSFLMQSANSDTLLCAVRKATCQSWTCWQDARLEFGKESSGISAAR